MQSEAEAYQEGLLLDAWLPQDGSQCLHQRNAKGIDEASLLRAHSSMGDTGQQNEALRAGLCSGAYLDSGFQDVLRADIDLGDDKEDRHFQRQSHAQVLLAHAHHPHVGAHYQACVVRQMACMHKLKHGVY